MLLANHRSLTTSATYVDCLMGSSHGWFAGGSAISVAAGGLFLGGLAFLPDLFDLFGADQTVQARAGRDKRSIDVFVAELHFLAVPGGDGRLEPLVVVG